MTVTFRLRFLLSHRFTLHSLSIPQRTGMRQNIQRADRLRRRAFFLSERYSVMYRSLLGLLLVFFFFIFFSPPRLSVRVNARAFFIAELFCSFC